MSFASGNTWSTWMKSYRFGTLVFHPNKILTQHVHALREKYDFLAAATSKPHITITQPFLNEPTADDLQKIEALLKSLENFEITIGPAITSPNKRLMWLDVSNKEAVLNVRESLHQTNLFDLDLPLTKGFIPHMTISEEGREPQENFVKINEVNKTTKPFTVSFDKVTWIVPDDEFVFQNKQDFFLRSGSSQ
jgi:2'-5' RNA ligase